MKTDFHLNDVLLLGDSRLYQPCAAIMEHELPELPDIVNAMANVILEFRARYGAGRAIAAPQLGVMKRLVVLNIDRPVAMINPELSGLSQEMMELWDDCMSFPNLLVRLSRDKRCKLRFRDLQWQEQTWELEDDLSELLQHECDHLDGILAISRALDNQSFKWRTRNTPGN